MGVSGWYLGCKCPRSWGTCPGCQPWPLHPRHCWKSCRVVPALTSLYRHAASVGLGLLQNQDKPLSPHVDVTTLLAYLCGSASVFFSRLRTYIQGAALLPLTCDDTPFAFRLNTPIGAKIGISHFFFLNFFA